MSNYGEEYNGLLNRKLLLVKLNKSKETSIKVNNQELKNKEVIHVYDKPIDMSNLLEILDNLSKEDNV